MIWWLLGLSAAATEDRRRARKAKREREQVRARVLFENVESPAARRLIGLGSLVALFVLFFLATILIAAIIYGWYAMVRYATSWDETATVVYDHGVWLLHQD